MRIQVMLTALLCLGGPITQTFAGDDTRLKMIDTFHSLDLKSMVIGDVRVKSVSTPDSAHPKALEVTVDYAKKDGSPFLVKKFKAGFINPAKYSGIRFFAKSDVESSFGFSVGGDKPCSDGSPMGYGVFLKGNSEWTEVVIPFSQFQKAGLTVWKDGVQKVYAGGASIVAEHYPQFTSVGFNFPVEFRGTSTTAHVLIEGLALIEK